MTRHSRAPQDPTAENGLRLAAMRDDLLGRFFDEALTDREKVVVVAALYYLESPGYLPSHGLDRSEAERLVVVALSKLRAYGRLMPQWDDLAQFRWDDLAQSRWDDLARYVEPTEEELQLAQQRYDIWDDRAPVKSNLIQSLAEELREFQAFCGHCGQEMWRWRYRFGRARSYCSNACKQAAYRARRGQARRRIGSDGHA